jgi:hypothetical protein
MQPKLNVAETKGVRIFGRHGVLAGTKEKEECKPHHIGGCESGFVRGRLRRGVRLVQDWERKWFYLSGGNVGFCIAFELFEQTGVDGILHFFNKTPIEWYSKKQATVETATYGSEFIAARTCVDQIVDLRSYIRYLGVPVNGYSYMIGDNKMVIDGATFPHAKLHKWHNALSFHRVCGAVASDMLKSFFIDGEFNPADILSKHWGYQQIWRTLQPLLFWQGDTAKLLPSPVTSNLKVMGSDKK